MKKNICKNKNCIYPDLAGSEICEICPENFEQIRLEEKEVKKTKEFKKSLSIKLSNFAKGGLYDKKIQS